MLFTIIPYVSRTGACSSVHASNVAVMSGSLNDADAEVADTVFPWLSRKVQYIVGISEGLLFIVIARFDPISLNTTLECSI